MSPGSLEVQLNELENKFISKLKANKLLMAPFIALLYLFFHFHGLLYSSDFKLLNFQQIAYSAKIIFLLILISFLFKEIKSSYKIFGQILIFFMVACFDLYNSKFGNGDFFSYASFPMLFILGAVFYLKNFKWYFFFITSMGYFLLVFYFADQKDWFFYKKPILFVCCACTHIYMSSNFSFKNKLKLFFNPAHLILPVNYPILTEEEFNAEDGDLWFSGFVQIIKAFTFIFLSETVTFFVYRYHVNTGIFSLSVLMYFRYLLLAPGVANIITGISKIFGVKVIDCSNHLWLASSPFEFLKRENVHAYEFSIRFFYFNFLKVTRNLYLILFCYFLLFPLYRDFSMMFYGTGLKNPELVLAFFKNSYFFWALLFGLLMSSFVIPIFKVPNKTWRGVLANHTVYIILFYILNLYIDSKK